MKEEWMTDSFCANRWRMLAGVAALALVAAVLPIRVSAQVATTTVQGTVYRADGSAATGTLLVSWPAFSTATNQAVAAGSITATIGQDGFVSLNLAPNQGAYPAGTYYTAVYHLNDGTVSKEYWVVPAAATTTISTIRAQLAPATIAVQPVSKAYVDSSISAITGNYLPLTGGTMSGTLVLEGDPTASDQAATKHYVDTLASTEVPLAGASMSGALNTPNNVNKLPRVDVRHPDFGAGCPNAADPTGQQDSTCAIQAAIAWSQANPQGRTYPDIYLAAGTYIISSALYVPCQVHFIGDGPQASILEQTNNGANAITVFSLSGPVQPNLWTCNGSLENLTIHAPGAHLYTATLVELQGSAGYTIYRVRFSGGGGRGLMAFGERLSVIDTEYDTVRWPITSLANETKFLDTQIASPGEAADGYCFGPNNCVNGVYPGYNWTLPQVLSSASANGLVATFVITGGSDVNSSNGISPLVASSSTMPAASVTIAGGTVTAIQWLSNGLNYSSVPTASVAGCSNVYIAPVMSGTAVTGATLVNGGVCTKTTGTATLQFSGGGHWFTIAGIPDLTALNGVWQVNAVYNNCSAVAAGSCSATSPNQYVVQTNIAATGTATVTGATYQPTILPENVAAVYIGGAAVNILGGSIKANWYTGCFKTDSVFSDLIEGFYCEGFPINGQPHLNADIMMGGLPSQTTLTGAISNGTAPVQSSAWMPVYINNPADLAVVGGGPPFQLFPPDYAPGSTTCSAYVKTPLGNCVQQGQFEEAAVLFSGDGLAHFSGRNAAGTTTPTSDGNIVWPAGTIISSVPLANYGTLTVKSSHLESIDVPSANWAAYCNDTNSLICATAIIGSIGNGYSTYESKGGPSAGISFENDEWWGAGGASQETDGSGFVKVPGQGRVTAVSGGFSSPKGETWETASGQYLANVAPTVMTVQYADGTSGSISYANPSQGTFAASTSGSFYESLIDNGADSVLGSNPGTGWAMGHQFAGSTCSYDTPPAGKTHSTYRFCMKGGPTNTGANAGWEYDIWNGSSWVNGLGISGQSNSTANLQVTGATEVQGGLTASAINGEITVDGVTYPNLTAAWNAAYAQANSTGKNQTVRLGPGTFTVTTTLNEPSNGACVSLLGSGGTTLNAGSSAATTLSVTTNLAADVFFLGNSAQAQGCTFKDFVILAGTNATHGFELQWFRGLLIDNVTVNDTTAEGILLGEETTGTHQANFLLRNVTVSYNAALFTPANRPAYGVHLQKTAIDSHLDDIVVRNALTAGVYNEGTGNTGSLVLEAGGVQLGSVTQGVINGLYDGIINVANCVAGFQVSETNGATAIAPLINGVVSGSTFAPTAGHMYTLRLRISCNEMQRVLQAYNSIDNTGAHTYGGTYLSSGGNVVLEVQDTTNGVAAAPVVIYSGSISNAPAAMTVGIINSSNLQCSIASFEISQQGPVWVVSTPPGGGPIVRRMGTTAQGADCKIERTGKLRFYPPSTPQSGELIAISYRTTLRAVARLANTQSIALESNNGQLPGTAAWIGTVTSPAARSSIDCENAASALLDLATNRAAAWKGKYTAWDMEVQGDIWPGDVLAITSTSANMTANVVVRTVQIEPACTSPGLVKYVVSFANDWADALAIKTSTTVPANVWLPKQPETAPPLANLASLSITSVSGSAIQVSANATPPTGGGFEVRRRDWAFGPGTNSDLVLRSPVANFSIPREAVMEQYYIRMYDGSTPPNYSRFSSAVFVNVAL
jgi:hypothetical protein